MISDFRGARLKHYCADGAHYECWNHNEGNSNCSIGKSDWFMALDTKFRCKLDAIWEETNPTLSFIWLLSNVCARISNNPEFFEHYCVPTRCKLYISLPPFTLSITCNTSLPAETTILLCGRMLMIVLLSYFEHCQIWLKVCLQTITTWAKTQNWGTKKTLLWVWTSVVVRFWLVLWLRVGEGACLN
jgi:hypothetical protein